MYEEGCLCMCSCCPTINIASKRPFYISKHAMNYSDYHDDTAKLTDTSLFIKCDTSEYPMWTQCPPQQQFSSIIFLTKALTVGFVSNVDSLYKRLLVFGIRFPFPRALNFIPLKIDHVDSTTYYCPFDPGTSTRYDSIHITFEKSLISTKTLPIQNFKNLRNPFHITNTRQGYVISGYHNGYLEIIDGQGKTVYHQFVFAPSCLIGKNVLRPGIYFFQMHNQAGTSSIKLPVF
jgi:hypothetical protein